MDLYERGDRQSDDELELTVKQIVLNIEDDPTNRADLFHNLKRMSIETETYLNKTRTIVFLLIQKNS